ncbi:hypothetical protein E2C01_040358 [Portunus trituberculatus]|uniref:Uncharacterized protein n=1 Tax=Portunus trituberculatus TaxID=210409 RepID=A0A5B7FMG6_PORTR|nr:hypothetical protein [Portunus trituberculatus]
MRHMVQLKVTGPHFPILNVIAYISWRVQPCRYRHLTRLASQCGRLLGLHSYIQSRYGPNCGDVAKMKDDLSKFHPKFIHEDDRQEWRK